MVAVESPTYYGLLQVVESLQLKTLEIPCSPRTGMSIEALELAFQTQPRLKAVVVVPDLQMPPGRAHAGREQGQTRGPVRSPWGGADRG
jgi:DNA-binding transcriptional MocR family regulator